VARKTVDEESAAQRAATKGAATKGATTKGAATTAVGAKAPPAKPKKLDARTAARYGRALDAMDRGDKDKARAELKRVLKEQPDFSLASLDLASLAK
jgi:predicted Zn-dependent protease